MIATGVRPNSLRDAASSLNRNLSRVFSGEAAVVQLSFTSRAEQFDKWGTKGLVEYWRHVGRSIHMLPMSPQQLRQLAELVQIPCADLPRALADIVTHYLCHPTIRAPLNLPLYADENAREKKVARTSSCRARSFKVGPLFFFLCVSVCMRPYAVAGWHEIEVSVWRSSRSPQTPKKKMVTDRRTMLTN
jgi:hypothetical protein